MCKLKSAIIMKDKIFIPDYDSHSDMLKQLGIEDSKKNAETLFVRAELSPKDNDVFSPVNTWVFKVDQDIRPEWFVENYEKKRMVKAVKEWAKNRIHIGIDGLKINSGANHFIKDCKNVEVYDSASISRVCGSASISKVCDSASISYVCDSASISEVYGSASISYVCDSASISKVYGSASISKVYGSAMIVSSPYSKWKNAASVILSDNATFKDNYEKVIYQSGNYKLISVENKNLEEDGEEK